MRCGWAILSIVDSTLNRAGKINMEQRTIDTMDDSDFARQDSGVPLVATLGDLDIVSTGMAVGSLHITSV